MTNLLKIKEIFYIGSHINHSNKNININEVLHHYHKPLSFIFNVVGSSENFHAELLQTFNDDNSIWIITEYFNELKNEEFDHSLNARASLIKIMQKKEHLIITTDSNFKIMSNDFRVKGTYPYSVFDILYSS